MEAPQGRIESAWRWTGPETIEWEVAIPNGCEGRFVLPETYMVEINKPAIEPGRHTFVIHFNNSN